MADSIRENDLASLRNEISAGRAALKLHREDPEFRRGLAKAQARLREMGQAMQMVGAISRATDGAMSVLAAAYKPPSETVSRLISDAYKALSDATSQAIAQAIAEAEEAVKEDPEYQRLEAEHQEALNKLKQYELDWEAKYGEPYPKELGDYARLAVRADVDPNYILAGKWTLADLEPIIEGYLQRLQDMQRQRRLAQSKPELPRDSQVCTPKDDISDSRQTIEFVAQPRAALRCPVFSDPALGDYWGALWDARLKVFCRTFDWLPKEILRLAGLPEDWSTGENATIAENRAFLDAHERYSLGYRCDDKSYHALHERQNAAWRALTNLPPLSTPDEWRDAATCARASPPQDFSKEDFERYINVIVAWARDRFSPAVFANSAGELFTHPHGTIWTVEQYLHDKELCERHGAVFNPALVKGSPAAQFAFANAIDQTARAHKQADKSAASPACFTCGKSLIGKDADRAMCHECRSDKGKVAELNVAILAKGDNPDRISQWPVIRHLLRKRYGDDGKTTKELWERCTDELSDPGTDRKPYLSWTLETLMDFLRSGAISGVVTTPQNEGHGTDNSPGARNPASDEQSEGTAGKADKTTRKKRGRNPDTDPEEDNRIANAWKEARRKDRNLKYEEFAKSIGITRKELADAINRDRQPNRIPRRRKNPSRE